MEDRAARSISDRGAFDGRRCRIRGRSGPRLPRGRREDRNGALADATANLGARLSRVVQRGWETVHRGFDGIRWGQPASGAYNNRAGRALSSEWTRVVRLCVAGSELAYRPESNAADTTPSRIACTRRTLWRTCSWVFPRRPSPTSAAARPFHLTLTTTSSRSTCRTISRS